MSRGCPGRGAAWGFPAAYEGRPRAGARHPATHPRACRGRRREGARPGAQVGQPRAKARHLPPRPQACRGRQRAGSRPKANPGRLRTKARPPYPRRRARRSRALAGSRRPGARPKPNGGQKRAKARRPYPRPQACRSRPRMGSWPEACGERSVGLCRPGVLPWGRGRGAARSVRGVSPRSGSSWGRGAGPAAAPTGRAAGVDRRGGACPVRRRPRCGAPEPSAPHRRAVLPAGPGAGSAPAPRLPRLPTPTRTGRRGNRGPVWGPCRRWSRRTTPSTSRPRDRWAFPPADSCPDCPPHEPDENGACGKNRPVAGR
ncbi:hypothetical protein HNR72_005719 [Streptomyces collinus]|uniref:Uncharacterized protein n=1 Tax=Streptomyces collinus TaxID=42684 RepID=A0AA89TJC4_STRCU|nr:hypothetical protein [Streptomyces collinus]